MASERELIGRSVSGDREAFDEIVERYQDALFRHLLRLTRSYEQAQDLSQEAFVRFYRRLSAFDARRAVAPFLLRIATNLWKDSHRPHLTVLGEEGLEFLASPRAPDQEALDRLEHQSILRAMSELRPELRVALSLRYDQELSYREIGEIMDVPPGTVATWLSRGLEALRAALAVEEQEVAR